MISLVIARIHFSYQLLQLLMLSLIRLGHEIVLDVVCILDLLVYKRSQHFPLICD